VSKNLDSGFCLFPAWRCGGKVSGGDVLVAAGDAHKRSRWRTEPFGGSRRS
jgi:hypothetical protein